MTADDMLFLSFGEHDGVERTLYCSQEEFWAVVVREKLGQEVLLWGPGGARKSARYHVLVYDIFRRATPIAQITARTLDDAQKAVEKHLGRLDAIYQTFEKTAPGRWDTYAKKYDVESDDYIVGIG